MLGFGWLSNNEYIAMSIIDGEARVCPPFRKKIVVLFTHTWAVGMSNHVQLMAQNVENRCGTFEGMFTLPWVVNILFIIL